MGLAIVENHKCDKAVAKTRYRRLEQSDLKSIFSVPMQEDPDGPCCNDYGKPNNNGQNPNYNAQSPSSGADALPPKAVIEAATHGTSRRT